MATAAAAAAPDGGVMSDSGDPSSAAGAEEATAHSGMLGAALHVVQRATPALRELLAPQGYRLVTTGHSLGAGTAALAALMLSSVAAPRSVGEELHIASAAAGQAFWRAAEWSAEALQADATAQDTGSDVDEGSGSERYGLASLMQTATAALDRASDAMQSQSHSHTRWSPPLSAVNCVAFAPPPVVDARTALASGAVGASYGQAALLEATPRDAFNGQALMDELSRSAAAIAAFGADDAPLVLSFCARYDAVPRTSMRNIRAFAKVISDVDERLEAGQELVKGRALETLRGSAYDDFGMGSRDLVVPGRVVILASDDLPAQAGGVERAEEWWAVVGDGQSLACLRYAEMAPRSISDHMAPVYRLALGAAARGDGAADSARDGGEFKAWLRKRRREQANGAQKKWPK